jgi:hypothetical protein
MPGVNGSIGRESDRSGLLSISKLRDKVVLVHSRTNGVITA